MSSYLTGWSRLPDLPSTRLSWVRSLGDDHVPPDREVIRPPPGRAFGRRTVAALDPGATRDFSRIAAPSILVNTFSKHQHSEWYFAAQIQRQAHHAKMRIRGKARHVGPVELGSARKPRRGNQS
ncbi:hypothetical protein [Sphaerisporangium rhizosphaerae]|uniref:Uncharacterized protein n=1 Tax=Sphaerisporangium rhizosphaerae TaxID=2269375 RepID=A0ABW2PBH3_9ACTN